MPLEHERSSFGSEVEPVDSIGNQRNRESVEWQVRDLLEGPLSIRQIGDEASWDEGSHGKVDGEDLALEEAKCLSWNGRESHRSANEAVEGVTAQEQGKCSEMDGCCVGLDERHECVPEAADIGDRVCSRRCHCGRCVVAFNGEWMQRVDSGAAYHVCHYMRPPGRPIATCDREGVPALPSVPISRSVRPPRTVHLF